MKIPPTSHIRMVTVLGRTLFKENTNDCRKPIVRIGPFKELIASGVKAGNLLTLSGQVSIDSEGNIVGAGDVCRQLRQAYLNVQ